MNNMGAILLCRSTWLAHSANWCNNGLLLISCIVCCCQLFMGQHSNRVLSEVSAEYRVSSQRRCLWHGINKEVEIFLTLSHFSKGTSQYILFMGKNEKPKKKCKTQKFRIFVCTVWKWHSRIAAFKGRGFCFPLPRRFAQLLTYIKSVPHQWLIESNSVVLLFLQSGVFPPETINFIVI